MIDGILSERKVRTCILAKREDASVSLVLLRGCVRKLMIECNLKKRTSKKLL